MPYHQPTEYSHIPEHPLRYVSQQVLDAARKCLQDHIEVLSGIAEDEDSTIVYSVADAVLASAVGVYTTGAAAPQGKHSSAPTTPTTPATTQDKDNKMTREQ